MKIIIAESLSRARPQATLTITGDSESMSNIKSLLEKCKELGDPGHTFEIIATDSMARVGSQCRVEAKLGGWDGDGSMRISSMELVEDE